MVIVVLQWVVEDLTVRYFYKEDANKSETLLKYFHPPTRSSKISFTKGSENKFVFWWWNIKNEL